VVSKFVSEVETMLKSECTLTVTKDERSEKGYRGIINLPSKIFTDSQFPFSTRESQELKIRIEPERERLVIEK